MSAYLTFFRGVPSSIGHADELINEDESGFIPGVEMLGMINPSTGKWDTDYVFKTKLFDFELNQFIEPRIEKVRIYSLRLPLEDGELQQLSSAVHELATLRERAPDILRKISESSDRGSEIEKDFFIAYLASLNQAFAESPDGKGFVFSME
jgi:hypothetical protein